MKRLALTTLAITALASPALAGDPLVFDLFDRNSSARIDLSLGAGSGMTNWSIDDHDRMKLQGFWYRTADMDHEENINNLFRVGAVLTNTNGFVDARNDTLAIRYEGPQRSFFIDPTWTLRGGTFFSNAADMTEVIRITNNNLQAPLVISFFQYSDFDLSGSNDGVPFPDVQVVIDNGGLHNSAIQTGTGVLVSETVVTPAPTHWQVGLVPVLLSQLNDNGITNLSDFGGPLGPGDLAWAFQWDFVIAPGQSVLISKDKGFIPTPGAAALIGLGGLMATRRRRA